MGGVLDCSILVSRPLVGMVLSLSVILLISLLFDLFLGNILNRVIFMSEIVLKLLLFFFGLLLLLGNAFVRMRIILFHIFWGPSRCIVSDHGFIVLLRWFLCGVLRFFFLFIL